MVSKYKPGSEETSKKWYQGIRALFPSIEAIDGFEKDNPAVLASFLSKLKKLDLINTDTKEALVKLVQSTPLPIDDDDDFFDISFDKFLQTYVNVSLSELTRQLNRLVERLDLRGLFNDKKIGAAMFSRLKSMPADTAIKRNYIRILAFYLAWQQEEQGYKFHFEKLLDLCATQPQDNGSHGVRIGFSINIIDINAFKLLRKLLKTCMGLSPILKPLKINQLTLESMFALFIDIPNTVGSDRISDAAPYGSSIREAIALSHQLLIKWQLSPADHLMSPNLTIGIMAGRFSELTHLRQILSTRHQNDFPQIKITEFVKKCFNENNVRTTINAKPEVMQIPNEGPLVIWTVEGLWSWVYIQMVDEMVGIPQGAAMESILLPNQYQAVKTNSLFTTAIRRFYQNSRNSMLGLEIAKTLYYQKDFNNALEVLQTILRERPNQINALTLRMSILFSQAGLVDDPEKAEFQFHRAEDIAERIFRFQNCHEEDAFNEIGQGRLTRAIQFLRQHRRRVLNNEIPADQHDKINQLIELLLAAEKAFIRAMNCTSTGHRPMVYALFVRNLLNIFRSQAFRFTKYGIQILNPDIYRSTLHQFLKDMGWLPPSQPENDFSGIEKPVMAAINSFGDSVRLQCFKPNINLALAMLVNDFDTRIFSHREKREIVEAFIEDALSLAGSNQEQNLHTYTYTRRGYGELLAYEEIREHLDVWLDIVRNNKETKLSFANMFK